MGKITYILKPFDRNKAYQGALVVAIDETYTSDTITNIFTDGTSWKVTEGFLGAGVAKASNNNFILTVSSVDYTFNGFGNGIGEAKDYILKMGEVATEVVSTGNGVIATTRSSTKREDSGDSTTVVDDTSYVYVDSLTPRDQFAIQALRGILARVDDPSSVSASVMSTYCDAAYQWAAQMMQAAGNARSTLDDETATEETQTAEVGSLENNSEKLLNNIVAALEKTDAKETITVPPSEEGGEPTIQTIYSERVAIPKLMDWLTAYSKHTPTGEEDTKKTVGLDDLIKAIKEINIKGGGGVPDKESLTAFTAEQTHDFLSFNTEGTLGYTSKSESKKAILGYLNDYATLSELYTALQPSIDARIRAWLQAMTIRVSTSHGTFDLTFDDTFVYTEEETATVIVNNPDQV